MSGRIVYKLLAPRQKRMLLYYGVGATGGSPGS